ncbi:MAG: ribonuclease R [Clostridiales bacterium]|jgi:ribonuclease R|nr:ribonuclease R [Clostridiales bacterium]
MRDYTRIFKEYKLYETFPQSVEKEANMLPDAVTERDRKGRRDFRDDLVITIDGDDSRDFDDAVSLYLLESGLWRLSVHIADVTHYVRAGTKLDKEAMHRGTSVYFPDIVLPMLPEKLSNGVCSLNEGVERLTLSVVMDIDKSGAVTRSSIKEGVIKSARRMTYSKVARILDGDAELTAEYGGIVPMLQDMRALAKILFDRRVRRGTIDFDVTESEVVMNADGSVKDVRRKPRLISHRIIEEFMLICNETVAEFMCGKKAPFVYREHADPSPEKVANLKEFLRSLNIAFNTDRDLTPADFAALLEKTPKKFAAAVNRITLRSMMKAGYSPVNKGHFGLAAAYYCHFTSPIRRYPDLLIHRIIKDYLKNGESAFARYSRVVAEAATLSSERERLAEKAERDVDDLKKAEFMRDKVGQRFDGAISGVTEWGLFVELDNTVEGLLRTEKLRGGPYEYNQKLHTLVCGKTVYRIGDAISVVVEYASGSKVGFKLPDR